MVTGKEKFLSVISYFSWLLLLIAYAVNEKKSEFVSHHVMQGLMLNIYATIGIVIQRFAPDFIGYMVSIVMLVYLVWGIVYSVKGISKDIPGLDLYKRLKR